MQPNTTLPQAYLEEHQASFLGVLSALIAQPSISSQHTGMEACARMVQGLLVDAGVDARVMPVRSGAPMVYGELHVADDARTLLVYGHYDVQPPEPLEAWQSPPFDPTLRDGRIYGRGAADNKGPLLAQILAVKSLRQLGRLPRLNLKFLIEGEEEVSSRNLPGFAQEHRDLLGADFVYIADGPMSAHGPLVSFGGRGLLYIELTAQGANRDGHSGHWGGVLPSPAWELVQLLASMCSGDNRCLIEGFYDGVGPPTAMEKQMVAALPFDTREFCAEWGLSNLVLSPGEGPYERILFQPTLNICGLTSGYGGPGSKTIIPARASAKLDIRLVPNQTPDDVWDKVRQHVSRYAPSIHVERLSASRPSKTAVELPISQAIIRAVSRAHGREPIIFPLTGGTSPRYVFTDLLGIPTATVPYANHDLHQHSANENLRIDCFLKGIQVAAEVFTEVAREPGASGSG